jgi:signal transduction histidine kinase/DNA-binding response OmpR family regulator
VRVRLFSVALRYEDDVVTARQRARHVAQLLGFDNQDQTRVATAVSEIARNAVTYGSGGRAEFSVEGETAPQLLVIQIADRGRGITNLEEVLAGGYRSETGMGRGIIGAKRLMDHFEIDTSPGAGTTVTLRKLFPRASRFWTKTAIGNLASELEVRSRRQPLSLLDELKQQNRELVEALDELERKQGELARLNAELGDTNRGVLALYAELDEKADHLRRADQLKTRFLSNMSHEFRTPLNSILALSGLLIDRIDGTLTADQEKQVGYIRKSATELLELVNDLLDLAKVEAGKITLRPSDFCIEDLFGALRGMLRPLLLSTRVNLVFEDASALPLVYGDEGKVSQIVRNFLSNALKFTEHGEIRVSASAVVAGQKLDGLSAPAEYDGVVLTVADTGIGIAPEDAERIFEEFTQVENPVQQRVLGTGLGLPLCKRLAAVLGGQVWVQSEVGVGSRFSLLVPRRYQVDESAAPEYELPVMHPPSAEHPVLLLEDRPEDRFIIESCLAGSPFYAVSTDRVSLAQGLLTAADPVAAIVDILLVGEESWRFLPELNRAGVPAIVVSTLEDRRKGFALGADAYGTKPVTREWLLETLYGLTLRRKLHRVLIADDEPTTRELQRVLIQPFCDEVLEAHDGSEALRLAREMRPSLLLLDLAMPHLSGFEVLEALRSESATEELAVVVCTSRDLSAQDRDTLARLRAGMLAKGALERYALLAAALRAVLKRGAKAAATPMVESEVRQAV